MNTSQIKIELFRKIDMLEENKLIDLYNFLIKKSNVKKDFWEELNHLQIADIEAGLADLDKGKKKDFNTVMAKHK